MAGLKEDAMVVAVAAVVIVGAAWYAKRMAGQAVDSVTETVADAWTASKDAVAATVPYVNPADSRNVVYSGIGAVGGKISGDQNWTLGGWIYDITH